MNRFLILLIAVTVYGVPVIDSIGGNDTFHVADTIFVYGQDLGVDNCSLYIGSSNATAVDSSDILWKFLCPNKNENPYFVSIHNPLGTTDSTDTIVIYYEDTLTFLGIGQSNMAGEIVGTYQITQVGQKYSGGSWVAYVDPGPGGGATIWPSVINYLYTNYSDSTLYGIVNTAVGGKGFTDTWKDSTSIEFRNTRTAVVNCNRPIDAIFIIGGEQDMVDSQSYNDVYLAIDTVILNLRDVISPTCPIIFANTQRDDYWSDSVRLAIINHHDSSSNIYVETDMYSLPHLDDVHRTISALSRVGKSMIYTCLKSMGYINTTYTYKTGSSCHIYLTVDKYLIPDSFPNYPYVFDLSILSSIAWDHIDTSLNLTVINQNTTTECPKYAVVDTANDSGYIVFDAPLNYTKGNRFILEIGKGIDALDDTSSAINSGYELFSVDGILDITGHHNGTLSSATQKTAKIYHGIYTNGVTGSVTHTDSLPGITDLTIELIANISGKAVDNNAQFAISNGKTIVNTFKGATPQGSVLFTRDGLTLVSGANCIDTLSWESITISSDASNAVCSIYVSKVLINNGSNGTPEAGTHSLYFNNNNSDSRTVYGTLQRYGIINKMKHNALAWNVIVHENMIEENFYSVYEHIIPSTGNRRSWINDIRTSFRRMWH